MGLYGSRPIAYELEGIEMLQRSSFPPLSQRTIFYIVVALMAGIFAFSSIGIVVWIATILRPPEAAAPSTYVAYDPAGDYFSPESQQAMAEYTTQFPEPQAVEILQGMSTAEISAYMVSQVSGGLKVDCTYCHDISNFAGEGTAQKATARQMMLMTADLNQNFITQLPATVNQDVGNIQITCATCHNGQNIFETYPAEALVTLPKDFQLPLDLEYPGGLVVTGQEDKSLDDVELNQNVMYHMNLSLGVGCTYCHNARYFPLNDVENKGYATTMLLMTQHLNENYLEAMNNKVPSCYTCHQEAQVPPGAMRDPSLVPAVLSTEPPQ
ncbi:MAG: photosynthetic reaction center cytochrome c subunit [Chloroflexi bacterium AL-W]|nr:photosynthetic reaction center cytochrome c subunit [Chloroflexi bacterium AL-N1]NOK70258.1 photosynthetic reaction center cytochrome c subunit [Chloroflexi bacterium AL-N10]NOK77795.1 photosynthetic reaction center cytochrome c subunit [Chloroflexi bacterium AL-N5]NOK84804.1 photosynthetic reaction center cytochrome c subunit [Chloroflexi bacterium AL-W]NOK92411.1 photosynthetic reaction center cytochrome c subunit [Chloroflexi bacterium AL-N15]